MSKRPPPWTEFRAGKLPPITEEQIAGVMEAFPHLTRLQVELQLLDIGDDRVWLNSRYQVNMRAREVPGIGWLTHLSIKRLDKDRVGPERYRDFMRIKDELCGTEREAVEIYPARSREVDTANQYHLWVLPPGMIMPFGFNDGRVITGESLGGARQHPFDKED